MTSLIFAVLQSACTAVIAISGVRVAIGLSALAEATIGIHAPAVGFHQDAIRIPMMAAASIGSLINLYVIWRIRTLRARPSSQWRVQAATPKQLRLEFFQIALAIFTLVSGGCGVDRSSDDSSGSIRSLFVTLLISI